MQRLLILLFSIVLTACANLPVKKVNNKKAGELNAELGLSYLQQGKMAQARSKLILAQQQAPHNLNVLISVAYFYQATSQPKLANQTYQALLKRYPDNLSVINNYAVFLCEEQQTNRAHQLFQRIIDQGDTNQINQARKNRQHC